VGATFEPGSDALDVRVEDHARNLARAERMLPGFAAGLDAARLAGWAGLRTATADRLPACGPIPADGHGNARCGRYVLTGLGARGLIWAPLCAEAIACVLEGEPNPVERSLLAALDPGRESQSAG
jgi:tRNA 5-methylaminomethyl-2-thiouridine biosynthesis bifunctional protein